MVHLERCFSKVSAAIQWVIHVVSFQKVSVIQTVAHLPCLDKWLPTVNGTRSYWYPIIIHQINARVNREALQLCAVYKKPDFFNYKSHENSYQYYKSHEDLCQELEVTCSHI